MANVKMEELARVQTVGPGGIGVYPPVPTEKVDKVSSAGLGKEELQRSANVLPHPGAVDDGAVMQEIDGAWSGGQGGGGSADIDLGVTDASVGDYLKVKSVDEDGKPTAWESEPVDTETIVEATDAWLEENISQETGYVLDRSLESSEAAAPADLVGELKTALTEMEDATTFSTVAGTNLIPISADGVGAYYRSGTNITYNASYTDYHYVVIDVKPNTRYFISTNPRWWVLGGSDGKAISGEASFSPSTKKFIDTGNAVKLYLTYSNSIWNSAAVYGTPFTLQVSEGNYGALENETRLSSVSNLSPNVMAKRYACAMPITMFMATVGIDIDIYYANALALNNIMQIILNISNQNIYKDHHHFEFASATANIPYSFAIYDENFEEIQFLRRADVARVFADNVSDCSALVIGDSTVEQNTMTQKMLDGFTERSHTLTLLGTQGTSPNLHEGRSGWGLYEYCTRTTNNPFYNPTTQKFDFSYYMTTNEYDVVDFVVIQLGINDLYAKNIGYDVSVPLAYYTEIIDSILAWNPDQKIILNLPTGVNPNYGDSYNFRTVRNNFVRFNAAVILETTKYPTTKVRVSNCHLILDPENDISDNVHPNSTGYGKMALEVINQINCWQND